MTKKIVFCIILMGVFSSCKEKSSQHSSITTKEISFSKEGELSFFGEENELLKKIDIEVAQTEYEMQTGLMYRQSMEEHQGMLFVYPDERPRPYFYMKNTYISLDLIYINLDKTVVDIKENTKPMDESSIPSVEPAQYVLEVNAGMSQKWNVKIGDKVDFEIY